ncbi:MAG: DUF3667 domain-containing protein [Sphingobacteriales bacterium]|nr:MAG: DUF3667 domain-containing protein [Sphingobacteriales bacterium]
MELTQTNCLNCGAQPAGAYCQDCGQKSDTHRISLPHLIKHDLVHGLWHFDKGLLFTLREAFLRPGHMAMEYIKGKRIRYYNIFYLILIVLGINILTGVFLKTQLDITSEPGTEGLVVHKDRVDVSYYVKHYFKLLIFFVIPIFAFGGYVSFRKLKLNYAEHIHIAGSILLAGAMWYFFVITGMYAGMKLESLWFDLLVWGFVVIAWLQPARVYYQAVSASFTTAGFVLRMLLWHACVALILYLILLLITAITGKSNITFT